jgi:opacity protein-like surface antigen
MKKPIAIAAALIFLAAGFNKAEAQSFEQGNILVSAGYGFGNFYKTFFKVFNDEQGYKTGSFGPIYVKGEYAMSDKVGLGANFAFIKNHAEYNFNNPTTGNPYKATLDRTAFSVNGRVNFHFANGDQIDPYFGVGAGFRSANWAIGDTDPDYTPSDLADFNLGSNTGIGFETTFGIRYYPMPMLGIYTEIGMAKSFLQLGLTYRLGAQ